MIHLPSANSRFSTLELRFEKTRRAPKQSAIGSHKSKGGEDRNRTYPATCVATTVLKTARATRHPSLSGVRIGPSRTGNDCGLRKDRQSDDATSKEIYLIFLIALTTASKSGQSPESSLEWRSFPLAQISNAPPLEGTRVSDLMRSPSSRILAAKLTALGV